MSKISYEQKALVLSSHESARENFGKLRWQLSHNPNGDCWSTEEFKTAYKKLHHLTDSDYNIIESLYNSERRRKSRVGLRVLNMYLHALGSSRYSVYFFTLTFNNKCLETTSKSTRRRYVHYFLEPFSIDYVANIDYGEKRGREHYHAVVLTDRPIDKTSWERKCGFLKVDPCYIKPNDIRRLTNYLAKLTNHTLKASTRLERVVYCKNPLIDKEARFNGAYALLELNNFDLHSLPHYQFVAYVLGDCTTSTWFDPTTGEYIPLHELPLRKNKLQPFYGEL